MTQYLTPTWIYVCFAGDSTIFLDTRQDRYLGLNARETEALKNALRNEPTRSPEWEDLHRSLLARGLLTEDPRAKSLLPVEVEPPDASLTDFYEDPPHIRTAHVFSFLKSCAAVWISLRFRSLELTVARMSKHKSRGGSRKYLTDPSKLRELVSVFRYLRPWIYVAKDHCLYDSLVLSRFLADYAFSTTCVFGVKTQPFQAHCWVQAGHLVLMGPVGFIRRYVPILAF